MFEKIINTVNCIALIYFLIVSIWFHRFDFIFVVIMGTFGFFSILLLLISYKD